jgi:hypothetical protein
VIGNPSGWHGMLASRVRNTIGTREGGNMSARKKLNTAYVTGSLVVAGFIGLMTQSLAVFVIVLAVLVALHFYEGNIRIDKGFKPH